MMSIFTKTTKLLATAYLLFGLSVLLDIMAGILIVDEREAYGTIRDIGALALRFLPGLCLLVFYSYCFLSLIRFGHFNRRLVLLHSILFFILGLGVAIPFMGYILSAWTPIGLPYRLLMTNLGTDTAYPAVVVLSGVFSSLNLYFLVISIRSKKNK